MRRKDREVTDNAEIEGIIRRCDYIHLGLMDEEKPYIVPLNFGVLRNGGQFIFYMHAAKEGKKLDLIRRCSTAAFCLDTGHGVVEGSIECTWSYSYESVMGNGRVELVEDREEKRRGLACIFHQYAGARAFFVPEQALENVAVLRLTVEEISGKRRV